MQDEKLTENEKELQMLYNAITPYISESGGREDDCLPEDDNYRAMIKRIVELEKIIGIQ